jgi:acyl carrier protein
MTRDEILRSMEELLEQPSNTLGGPEKLESLERWNSLAMIGFIALVDEHFGVTLSPRQIVTCSSVDDLLKLVPFV